MTEKKTSLSSALEIQIFLPSMVWLDKIICLMYWVMLEMGLLTYVKTKSIVLPI